MFYFYFFSEEPIAREDTTLKDDVEEDVNEEDAKDEQTEVVAVEVTSEQPRSLGMNYVSYAKHPATIICHSLDNPFL